MRATMALSVKGQSNRFQRGLAGCCLICSDLVGADEPGGRQGGSWVELGTVRQWREPPM